MSDIEVEDIIEAMHDRCSDTTYSQEESATAYEEIAHAAEVAAAAIREDMKES